MFSDFKKILQYKKYSKNTITSYIGLLTTFQSFVGDKIPIHRLDSTFLLQYIRDISLQKNYAYTTQKQLLSALQLYFKEMHNTIVDLSTVKPRAPQRVLPEILSLQETKRLLEATTNPKHAAMLTTVYALGLRSGELLNLKIKDLDGERNTVFIQAAKGKKDRLLPFPQSLKKQLRAYFVVYKPKVYLFEGQSGGAYTATSLRAVFNTSKKRAQIQKHVTLHSLRHAYATHLLESGTDIRYIQELLGHNSIKTTMIYTHVSKKNILNVTSPIDFLGLD